MRTTLTLDDDVAAQLRSEVLRTGQILKQVVNEILREYLSSHGPTIEGSAAAKSRQVKS
jgi:uncharacterized protein (DUF4415 family)